MPTYKADANFIGTDANITLGTTCVGDYATVFYDRAYLPYEIQLQPYRSSDVNKIRTLHAGHNIRRPGVYRAKFDRLLKTFRTPPDTDDVTGNTSLLQRHAERSADKPHPDYGNILNLLRVH